MSPTGSDSDTGAVHIRTDKLVTTSPPVAISTTDAGHTAKRQEAAALLALWSTLVPTKGAVRSVLSDPAGDLFPAVRAVSVPPPVPGLLRRPLLSACLV